MKRSSSRRKESSYKILYFFFGVIFIAGLTFLCFFLLMPPKKQNPEKPLDTIVTAPKAKVQTKTESTSDSSEVTESTESNLENPEKTPKQTESTPNIKPNELNLSLTKNEVTTDSQGRRIYQVRITIYELLNEAGQCVLEMKSSSGDYLKRTANTFNDGATSASCEGFDVLTEGISSGTYNFTIKATVGRKTGTITGIINI